MNPCCPGARAPEVQKVEKCPRPPCSLTQTAAKLLDGPPVSVPLSPFKDLRSQLTDFRYRQEELFRQLMDEQKGLQYQVLTMQYASKAIEQRQVDLIAEFRQFSSKSAVAGVTKDVIATSEQINSAPNGTAKPRSEAAGIKCLVKDPVQDAADGGEGCRAVELRTDVTETQGNEDTADNELIVTQTGSVSFAEQPQVSEDDGREYAVKPSLLSTPPSPPKRGSKGSKRNSKESEELMQIISPAMSQKRSTQMSSASSEGKAKARQTVLQFSLQHSATMGLDKSLKHKLEKLLQRQEFEFGIAMTILSNAFIICWECQYIGLDIGFQLQYPGRELQAREVWAGAEIAFKFFDWAFGFIFLIEMVLKLIVWRTKYFYAFEQLEDDDEWDKVEGMKKFPCLQRLLSVQGWNFLDFTCVLAFLFDKVAVVGSVNPQILRLLRLFRLVRLVRLLRFLETVDQLYIMTTAIASLTKVLSWAILLLSVMLLACDLLLVQLLQSTYFDKVTAGDLSEAELRKHHEMYAYFGTCTRCMLSMFEITLGNWPPVARLLSEEVSEWFTLLCLAHKLTIGFAVIGVITGVILQETFKLAQTDDVIMFRNKKLASTTLRKKMQTLFDALDEEGDGRLVEAEFQKIGDFPEIKCWLASLEIETDDLQTLFALIDTDGNGYITLDELVARMPRIKGNARSIDMLAMLNRVKKFEERRAP